MILRQVSLLCCVVAFPWSAAHAQAVARNPMRDSVVAVVQEFFRSMEANDAAAAARILVAEGVYFGTRTSGDSVVVQRGTFQGHLDRLRSARDTILERMWEPVVQVHDAVATVWAPYDLYRSGAFSHCGVDAFTLIRSNTGWRISAISFTIQPTGCAPSPLGPPPKR